MVATVSPQVLPERGGFDGYVQLASSEPAETELVAVPRETVDEGRNVSYAMQWLLFATVAVVGWFVFLRREAREDSEATPA